MISDDFPSAERRFVSFPITEFSPIKRQLLDWATSYTGPGAGIFCWLDNQGYSPGIDPGFEGLLAVGVADRLEAAAGDAFSRLRAWAGSRKEWFFGHFGYGLSAETEGSVPGEGPGLRPDPIGFPDLFFFIPEVLVQVTPGLVRIGSFRDDQEAIWRQILFASPIPDSVREAPEAPLMALRPPFKARFTRAEYLDRVEAIRRDILRGDCYEVNFCQEFYSQPVELDPPAAWRSLSAVTPNPFSCFYRLGERYLLCASPERFLKKTGDRLISQPIKGTSPRHPDRPAADQAAGRGLYLSKKDRSENVMVVDLVRNDLSRVCLPGSVRVDELYGIYPFPQVFQMISTISGRLSPGVNWPDVIQATFPMGSMTGAPKHRVIGLIEQYERSGRGIFSGAVGYVTPEGDFDFNVVIRSLLYNRGTRYLSYQVGSGITFYSDPAAEYEECLVKAAGILRSLGAG